MSLYITYAPFIDRRETKLLVVPENIETMGNKRLIKYNVALTWPEIFDEVFEYLENHRTIDSFEIYVEKIDAGLLNIIYDFLLENDITIGLLVSNENQISLNEDLFENYGAYVSTSLSPLSIEKENKYYHSLYNHHSCDVDSFCFASAAVCESPRKERKSTSRISKNSELEESFKDKLFRLMAKYNKNSVEIYTKGGITKQVFSKIISYDYEPKKPTIISLIIGLELDIDDALDLLQEAGYTLSNSLRFDSIVKTFITLKNYDLIAINIELEKYGIPILGWKPREDIINKK